MLKELVSSKAISPIDRLVLEDELFALLKATEITLDKYLDFITAYSNEDSHLSLLSIAIHLRDIYKLLEGEMKEKIANEASEFLEKILDNIGFDPRDGENMGLSIIRGTLLTIAVELKSEKAKEFSLTEFEKMKNGEKVSADIKGSIKSIAASLTNDKEWFEKEFENPESESEFISTITAMTKYSEKALLEEVQEKIFSVIPNRNRGFAIISLCSNPVISQEMFEFYLANLDAFESMNHFMYQNAIVSVILTGLERLEEFEKFFFDYKKQKADTSDAIDVGIEQLHIALQFKNYLNS